MFAWSFELKPAFSLEMNRLMRNVSPNTRSHAEHNLVSFALSLTTLFDITYDKSYLIWQNNISHCLFICAPNRSSLYTYISQNIKFVWIYCDSSSLPLAAILCLSLSVQMYIYLSVLNVVAFMTAYLF